MTSRAGWAALLALAACLAPDAQANAPTPYFFVGAAQLLVGNALIGAGEGWLIARAFKVRTKRAIAWMIAANYASSWIGLFLPSVADFSPPLRELRAYLAWGTAGFVAASAILEWPFAFAALRGVANRGPKSLGATLLAQAASYAILIPLYFWASFSAMPDDIEELAQARTWAYRGAVVYYRSSDGQRMQRLRLSDGHPESVEAMPAADDNCPYCVINLAHQPDWQLRPLYGRGLRAADKRSAQRSLWLETPFVNLSFGQLWLLPDDQVVFAARTRSIMGLRQHGIELTAPRSEICLFDLRSGRLAVLAEGRDPVVVLADP